MVKPPVRYLFLSLAVILSLPVNSASQSATSGRLTGTVTDPQGGVIPGAVILAKNDKTGSEFRGVANGVGAWTMTSVPGGSYTISVSGQGFRTIIFKEIELDTGATAKVDATLQIGLSDTVIVTASNFEEEMVNAPATVTVISEQMIRESPSQNLAEMLRSVPGMNVAQTSAREFGVTSRAATGAEPGTQLVLMDGRTLYQDYLGYIAWDGLQTSLNDIQQVEIIRGPGSAVWGANAMNGVVNIITKSPRQMLGTTLTLGAGTFDRSGGAAESNTGSLYYMSASHAQALNDRWAFKISGGAYTHDAFARPQGTVPNAFHTPYPQFTNEGTTQPNGDARVDHDSADGKQHFTLAGGAWTSSGILHGGLGGAKLHPGTWSSYGKLDYVHDAFKITGYVNILDGGAAFLVVVDPAGKPVQADIKTQTYNLEFSDSYTVHARHMLSYGGSFRQNHANISLMPEFKRRSEGGAYFQDEILLSERFRWVAGARVDKFKGLKDIVFSPRTTFIVTPVPGHTFRISYNRAFVAPSMFANYLQITYLTVMDLGLIDPQLAGNYCSFPMQAVGNKHLEEQSLNAYEAGYTATIAKSRARLGVAFYVYDSNGNFAASQIGSYTSRNPPPGWPLPPFVLDALVAANTFGLGLGLPSIGSFQNLGRVRNKGLELNADARISRYISGFANYSRQARPESNDYDISLYNVPPTHRFNAGLNFDNGRYLGNVSVGYTGSAFWNDVLTVIYSGTTKAYTVVNVGAGVHWGERRKCTAILKVSNLANTPVQNHIYGDILKRQIAGEFRLRF
jgi:outer membrane receptor protein involved in Fe transport